jgi:predicted GNAT superfamily acetyltransferase
VVNTTRRLRVRIRPLTTAADYSACVELQELVWGPGDESVPVIILRVSQRVGAIAAGAFDADGRMLGCVFGLTGPRDGRIVHWSHLLAVRPDARDLGIGRRLKRYQRTRLVAMGVPTMYWAFDPLVARNAHLNLNRLGAVVEEYIPEMYGPENHSSIDRGIGSDRFVVRWDLGRRARAAAPGSTATRVEIPNDIHVLRDQDPDCARRWRLMTRQAFQSHLKRGYRVAGFHRSQPPERSFYLLSKP